MDLNNSNTKIWPKWPENRKAKADKWRTILFLLDWRLFMCNRNTCFLAHSKLINKRDINWLVLFLYDLQDINSYLYWYVCVLAISLSLANSFLHLCGWTERHRVRVSRGKEPFVCMCLPTELRCWPNYFKPYLFAVCNCECNCNY